MRPSRTSRSSSQVGSAYLGHTVGGSKQAGKFFSKTEFIAARANRGAHGGLGTQPTRQHRPPAVASLDLQCVDATLQLEKSQLAPEGAPAIADDPAHGGRAAGRQAVGRQQHGRRGEQGRAGGAGRQRQQQQQRRWRHRLQPAPFPGLPSPSPATRAVPGTRAVPRPHQYFSPSSVSPQPTTSTSWSTSVELLVSRATSRWKPVKQCVARISVPQQTSNPHSHFSSTEAKLGISLRHVQRQLPSPP